MAETGKTVFNVDKFMSTQFLAREEEVEVNELKPYFNGKKAIWKVRGLKGIEIARARDSTERNKVVKAVVEGIVSNSTLKKTDAIKEMLGVNENVPNDIAYRIELLVLGSIEPAVDYPLATKLCENFPIEFYDLTNKILQLSGRGHEPGKVKASGKTTKSKQH